MRSRMRNDANALAESALRAGAAGGISTMPVHMADLGSGNFEQSFSLALMENEEATLDQIEFALERIEDGLYAKCEQCDCRIPRARLDAIPQATMCVKCAEEYGG